jgi:precorrin-6B methylase 2
MGMSRLIGMVVLLAAVGFALDGSARPPAAKPDAVMLDLELPFSARPPANAPDRVSELKIDGKDFSTPRFTRRFVEVKLGEGARSVKVVYTFWPTIYQCVTRTRVIEVERGKKVKASLLKPDPDHPDKIRVIYVPTPPEVVEAMCRLAEVGGRDVVWDVGCGDGRLVIHAVKDFKAKKGLGIDLVPALIERSKANAKRAGVDDRVTFEQKDALAIKDFSEASVVLLYLGERLNEALRPALQKTLKPGSRVVSHRFRMGDWKPDKTRTIRARDNYGQVKVFMLHLWTIKKR